MTLKNDYKIGIDLGGTKIAAIALYNDHNTVFERRVATPKGDYGGVLSAIVSLVAQAQDACVGEPSIGIGIPGSISPQSGLVQNANSTWMNAKPFQTDIQAALGQPVKIANDANCLALSESFDGVATGAKSVFGVIIGTGCGGGLIVDGKLMEGRHAIGGEWGHTPLPWIEPKKYPHELPGEKCWCGQSGCLETWLSGPGLERDHFAVFDQKVTGEQILAAAEMGDGKAKQTLHAHASRLARGLALITNIYDPEVIVLGGGLSNMDHLYDQLPALMKPFVFADHFKANIQKPAHGDASGVRGAARLWD